jgi:hypothetical protein
MQTFSVQPFAFVTVTQYWPLALTTVDCVVAPFDQRYDVYDGFTVSVTDPPGSHTAPTMEIVGVGFGLIVTGRRTGLPQTSSFTTALPPGPCQRTWMELLPWPDVMLPAGEGLFELSTIDQLYVIYGFGGPAVYVYD